MKRFFLIGLLGIVTLPMLLFAAGGRSRYGNDPLQVLDSVASEANDEYRIQETQLDDLSPLQGSYPTQYRFANTLDALRQNISPYIDRAFFIGLALAVILLIYNGLLLVTNSFHGQGERGETKKRLVNVFLGTLALTGVYAIVRILMALLGWVLG